MDISYSEPGKLLVKVEAESAAIPEAEFFNSSRYTKLREAWCASMFGIGYSKYIAPCEIAVNDTKYKIEADFFLKTKTEEWPFQLAEVQRPDRKRGKEYKESKEPKFSYEPAHENAHASDWVIEGINKKSLKHYADSENLNLLVYVNFEVSQFNYNSILEKALRYKGKFLSIWLITNTHICSLFSPNNIGSIPGWGEVRHISNYYV